MTVSVLTLVRGREAHLRQLVEGLRRSRLAPGELVIAWMDEAPPPKFDAAFPIRVEALHGFDLPLAAARNLAARAARHDRLVFLDVDCIAMADCLGRLGAELDHNDGLLCADVRYLGPEDARGDWTEDDLLAKGRHHPARAFPTRGVRVEPDPGLFWSLAFAVWKRTFEELGGFDEAFVGYGGEDTDLGLRAAARGLPLLFVGGAIACHQHHRNCDPPLQHFADIVRNARTFHDKWRQWPMPGWLEAFTAMGLIEFDAGALHVRRFPTDAEILFVCDETLARRRKTDGGEANLR